jgi:predicted DNA-binding transcriptional regulator AlpA
VLIRGEPTKGFAMTLQDLGERRRIAASRKPDRDKLLRRPDAVLSFAQWCALNGFSKATGRRIVKRGEGPPVLQLSPRRIGVRESDNRAWQAARVR